MGGFPEFDLKAMRGIKGGYSDKYCDALQISLVSDFEEKFPTWSHHQDALQAEIVEEICGRWWQIGMYRGQKVFRQERDSNVFAKERYLWYSPYELYDGWVYGNELGEDTDTNVVAWSKLTKNGSRPETVNVPFNHRLTNPLVTICPEFLVRATVSFSWTSFFSEFRELEASWGYFKIPCTLLDKVLTQYVCSARCSVSEKYHIFKKALGSLLGDAQDFIKQGAGDLKSWNMSSRSLFFKVHSVNRRAVALEE